MSSEKINILAAQHEIVGSNSKEHIDTLLGPISKLDGNIALLRVQDNIQVDMEIAIDVVDGLLKCFPGQKFFLIADARKILTNASMDALSYAAVQHCMAQAILTDSQAISLIANFYAKTLKQNKNVRLVKNMSEAENWLKDKVELLELKQPS